MSLVDKRKAIMSSSKGLVRLFEGTTWEGVSEAGTVTPQNGGILLTSSAPSWRLYIEPNGSLDKFKTYRDLFEHQLKLDATIEWSENPPMNSNLVVSLAFVSDPRNLYAYRGRYVDFGSSESNGFRGQISESFTSRFNTYPNGTYLEYNLWNCYFVVRVYLNAPEGTSCMVKRLNIYDMGTER